MVPGQKYRAHALTLVDGHFVEADTAPVARLLIHADFVGPEFVAMRLGAGRYLFEFTAPVGYPVGTEVFIHKTAVVDGEHLAMLEEVGKIQDGQPLATKQEIDKLREGLVVINEALKLISVESGVPHLSDIP